MDLQDLRVFRENQVLAFKQNVRERQSRIMDLCVKQKEHLEQCQQTVLLKIKSFKV